MPPPIDPRLLLQNPDGTVSSERTKSFQVAELNSGKETLIPTVVDGKQLTDEDAIQRAIKTGIWKSFDSIPEANAYAKRRSETGALALGPLGQPRGRKTMIGPILSSLGSMAGSSALPAAASTAASFLPKLLQGSEFSIRSPKFDIRIGDRNKRIKDALMKRIEEMTLGKTNPVTTSALDVKGEFDPVSGMTSVFQPDPFQEARRTMFQGPQKLRMR